MFLKGANIEFNPFGWGVKNFDRNNSQKHINFLYPITNQPSQPCFRCQFKSIKVNIFQNQ